MIINESNVPVHQSMFRSLLKTPHKRIDETLQIHKQQFSLDPSFYGKIATWSVYHENNIIRDVNEIFIAMLFASDFPEHREAAFVMLQSLPLYQVARVVRCYTGYNEFVRHSSLSKKPAPVNGNGVTVLPLLYGKKHPKAGEKIPRKTIKLKGKLPKFLKNEFYVDYFFVKHECLNKKMLRGLFVKAVKY